MLNIDRPGLWVSSSTEHQGSKVFKGSLPNAISDRNFPGQLFGCAQKTAVDESSCDDLMETSYCTLFLQYLPSFDILCFFKSIINMLYLLCSAMPLFGWKVWAWQDYLPFCPCMKYEKQNKLANVDKDIYMGKPLKMIHIFGSFCIAVTWGKKRKL